MNLEAEGYTVIQFDHNGNKGYEFELAEKPIDIFEGEDGILFMLIDENEQFKLSAIESNGLTKWTTALNGANGVVSGLERAEKIYGSPSNTTTVIGSNDENNLLIAFIDPRGNLVFQRSYQELTLGQVRDFVIARDGTGIMVLTGVESGDRPSFSVFKLNHRGVNVWRGDFILNEAFRDVEVVELSNRDVVLLTSTGDIFYVNAVQ